MNKDKIAEILHRLATSSASFLLDSTREADWGH